MKKTIFTATAVLLLAWSGTGHADMLSGKVESIDNNGNSLTLVNESKTTSERQEYKLVWEASQAEAPALQASHVGDFLTVTAEQNPVTRNWRVQSLGGPVASAEQKLLQTAEQTISGDIRELNIPGNSLVLVSDDKDSSGNPIEYHVVWDDSNTNVREHLEKAKIDDDLTLTADQNIVTKNWKAKSIAGPIKAMAEGDIHTLTGQVKEVDPNKNFIVLATTDDEGRAADKKIVWDNDFKQQSKLENAKIGEHLSVRADQNMVTRNWKVQAIS